VAFSQSYNILKRNLNEVKFKNNILILYTDDEGGDKVTKDNL
jgi:hypothetical protein